MATLHLLGTGAALSDASRTTTMLAVQGGETLLLVDCGGDAAQRLLASGLALEKVTGLIVTHEHADHVSGFPLLMERLWLAGIGPSFDVYGIEPAVAQAKRTHEAFDTASWPGYPEIRYHQIDHCKDSLVLETDDLLVRATPGDHAVPVVGLRFDDKHGGGVLVLSGDTERSSAITELARDADVLVHEATGKSPGHSSALEAAEVAASSGARRLILVHLPPDVDTAEVAIADARQTFPGLELGADGGRVEF